jgi:hypothetical protein
MRQIACRACGKHYDYDIDGCCPQCGAYNRPPRRVRVDAEGQLHAATGDKVCYEKKECFEEQTRHRGKVSFSSLKRAEEKRPLNLHTVQSAGQAAYVKGKTVYKKGKQNVAVGIMLAILVAVMPSIVDSCADRAYSGHNNPDVSYEATTEIRFPNDGNKWYEMNWGDTFAWHGEDTYLADATYEDSRSIAVTVSTNIPPETDEPYVAVNGNLDTRYPPTQCTQTEGEYTYYYLLPDDGNSSNNFEGRTDVVFEEAENHAAYVVNIW